LDQSAAKAFVNALPKSVRAKLPKGPELETKLSGLVQRARKSWPGLDVPPAKFLAHLGRHLKDAADPLEGLARLRGDDLYLALACALQEPKAIEKLEAHVRSDIRAALAGQRLDDATFDEVTQRLQARLLLSDGGKEPRIATYGGHGPLAAWICAAAVRLALDLRREGKGGEEVDERMADQLADQSDFELSYIKQRYRKEFRVAFQEAFQALDAQERNLLRFNFIDGLNIEQIGTMTGVHRATVARRIARIREELFEGTRKVLRERFKLSGSELNSLLTLVKSDFDVSLSEALRSHPHSQLPSQKGRGSL
jgi:RNA polymerase sigma-70 factor (ECF subfamily)